MSLDVYLYDRGIAKPKGFGIFVRQEGRTVEITREQWDAMCPDREPIVMQESDSEYVYSGNITHNFSSMAREVGIYDHCWQPDKIGVTHANQLIRPFEKAIVAMAFDPLRFKAFNPSNGWGTYEGFLAFLQDYLVACREYPQAEIKVWA